MTCDDRQYERLFQLLDDWCDGSLVAEQIEQLDRLLRDDPAARWQYLCYMNVHGGLGLSNIKMLCPVVGGRAPAVPPHCFALPRPSSVLGFLADTARWTREYFSQPVPFSMLTAAIFMVCVVAILSILPAPTYEHIRSNCACNTSTSGTGLRPVKKKDDQFNFVARITGLHNCRWSPEGRAPYSYDHMGIGRKLKLDSGMVEITYYNGAKLVLEGPVEFTVEKPNACRLDLGKLTANVSQQAVGFTVETPGMSVVDLSTEFGMSVKRGGATEVHVIDGLVKAKTADGTTTKIIRAGEAALVDPARGGRLVMTRHDAKQFVRSYTPEPIEPITCIRGSYDGTYDPATPFPPEGQSRWCVFEGKGLQIVPNSDCGTKTPGHADFIDQLSGQDLRIQMSRFHPAGHWGGDPAEVEYEFFGRLKFLDASHKTHPYAACLVFGFRSEGGRGKTVALGWMLDMNGDWAADDPGLALVGPLTRIVVPVNTQNYADGKFHEYYVKKFLDNGIMKVQVLVDGVAQLDEPVPYSMLDDNADMALYQKGFGLYGSSTGRASLVVDQIEYRSSIGRKEEVQEQKTGK